MVKTGPSAAGSFFERDRLVFFDNGIGFGQKPVVNLELAARVAGEVCLDIQSSSSPKL